MLARGKPEVSRSLQVTFTKVKCMIRMMNVLTTKRGFWGAKRSGGQSRGGSGRYSNTYYSPPYLKVLPTPLLRVVYGSTVDRSQIYYEGFQSPCQR